VAGLIQGASSARPASPAPPIQSAFPLAVDGVEFGVDLSPQAPTLRARIRQISGLGVTLHDLTLDCPLALPRLECQNGQLRLRLDDGPLLEFVAHLRRTDTGVNVHLAASPLLAKSLTFAVTITDGGAWKLRITGSGLDLSPLHDVVPERWRVALAARWPSSASGQIDLDISAAGQGSTIERAEAVVATDDLNFTAIDAAEAATTRAHLLVRNRGGTWWFQIDARHADGLLYVVPGWRVAGGLPGLLMNPRQDGALDVNARGSWQPSEGLWRIDALRLSQGDWLAAEASLEVRQGHWQNFGLSLAPTPFAALYRVWLQPFLAGSPLDALEAEGRLALSLEQAASDADLHIDFLRLSVRDTQARFALEGLNGRIAVGARRAGEVHTLAMDGLRLHGLPLGPARLTLAARPDGFALEEAVDIPLLDGHFVVERLALLQRDAARAAAVPGHASIPPSTGDTPATEASLPLELRLAGVLTPVSLPALCDALGLPRAAGRVSGMLPEVIASEHEFRIDGNLLLRLFDGRIVARNLRVLHPFATLAELATDLQITHIDLGLLTREGYFGRVKGRLGGHVRGLRLQAWQPVAMDLELATPPDNDRPRRISQRAVDSLSALAGGGAGLLSRGFMRFFSEYSYGRLGVGCRLIDGICTVSGVERAADGGVVLVSRGGLIPPFIEVRASGREISWRSLTEIYRRIASGELELRQP